MPLEETCAPFGHSVLWLQAIVVLSYVDPGFTEDFGEEDSAPFSRTHETSH